MNYMDVKTAAKDWRLSERRITTLCRNGRIEGAKKELGVWLLPIHTKKPVDGRKNKFSNITTGTKKLPLPIGVSDFKKLVTEYYYVDKTLLLKDFLDTRPQVSLFTRPRRFGKTLTMDMIKTFFEISKKDTSLYFKNLAIWNCGREYRQEQGKYPVIFLTFKDVKFLTWKQTYEAIQEVIAKEYRRHMILLESDMCNEYDKKYFRSVIEGTVTEVGLTNALQNLSYMLHVHYEVPAIIIIDEYDTPIHQGYSLDYYEQIVSFMRNLFSGAFKDNSNLAFGFLTGILRVAKESIFSGLNNLTVHSMLDEKYSAYFGFTSKEVKEMTEYYQVTSNYDEICSWYDGYCFGKQEIFNPWSVINYFYNDCVPKAFWQSTGDNSIIRQIVSEANEETKENLQKLMQGQSIVSYIDMAVIYPEITNNPTTIYSFLLAAGYLKTVQRENLFGDNSIYHISIPNKEILSVYEKEILSALSEKIPFSVAMDIQQAIIQQDIIKLQEQLQKLLLHTISSFDYAHENFYHGFLLGICAIMNQLYRIDFNKESGHGRYDIQLMPFDKKMPGIIMELKVLKDKTSEDTIEIELEKSAKEALNQIDQKEYITVMKQEGIHQFIKIGISFYKKYVKIMSKTQ